MSPCSNWPWSHMHEGKDECRAALNLGQLCLKNKGKQEMNGNTLLTVFP
jgi:hypothetical protein